MTTIFPNILTLLPQDPTEFVKKKWRQVLAKSAAAERAFSHYHKYVCVSRILAMNIMCNVQEISFLQQPSFSGTPYTSTPPPQALKMTSKLNHHHSSTISSDNKRFKKQKKIGLTAFDFGDITCLCLDIWYSIWLMRVF